MTDFAHITLPQVARLLRVPYRRAYELLLTGEFKGEKIGGQWHIDSTTLQDYLIRRGVLSEFSDDARA